MPSPSSLPGRRAARGGLRPASRAELVRHWMTRTFSGRAIVAGVVVKVVAFALALVAGNARWVELIDTCGDLAIITGALIIFVLVSADMKRRLLWRIRRKLAVSYVFMGFVPVFLVIVFFMVAGLLLFYNFASHMMRTELSELVERARFASESASLGVEQSGEPAAARSALEVRQKTLASRHPGASIALVPSSRCASGAAAVDVPRGVLTVGPWGHVSAPAVMPGWVPCGGYSGLIEFKDGETTHVAARAVIWPAGWNSAVIVDVPVDEAFARGLRERAGLAFSGVTLREDSALGRPVTDPNEKRPQTLVVGPANIGIGEARGTLTWETPVDSIDWDSGGAVELLVNFETTPADIYDRIAPIRDTSDSLLVLLAIIGVMFLIIQVVAFAMGLALARSITGSVHELAEGTERVRRGDFAGRVSIKSRDQLGELAESFNSMTSSMEDLLQQKAEKERLEQELRIARSIQMSLLPQGPLTMPGLSLVAHCEPAREVGGDYYDFLPIDEHTLGILVADVSGKGTSAALYMAELKGIVLSLSQRYRSPREMLIEADRIISRHLDSRSFITVTYLVVDVRAGTLQYARAGHCPMIYVPGPYAEGRSPQLMTPDGMVLGLQLDEGRTFNRLLDEVTLPISRGDLFVLYTDGLSEAMNSDGDCFGDTRLADLVAQHADLPADQLRERILREIDAFTGSALQQDDMTMVLLRVEQVGQPVDTPALAHADA